jgi:hypothetical protein
MTTSIVVTDSVELTKTKTPALPLAPVAYDRAYLDSLNNILRQYFNTIDNLAAQLSLSTGGSKFYAPYGAFQDLTIQTTTADTATVMTFDTVDFASGVSIVSGSRITVEKAGLYNLQWSAQFKNTDNAIHDVSIWLRQDGPGAGIDIPGSKGVISLPARKSASAGDEAHQIYGWNYFVSLGANEFVELWWATESDLISITTFPATTTPVVTPATASVVATMTFVSAL